MLKFVKTGRQKERCRLLCLLLAGLCIMLAATGCTAGAKTAVALQLAPAQAGQPGTLLQGVEWGMSPEQVTAAVGKSAGKITQEINANGTGTLLLNLADEKPTLQLYGFTVTEIRFSFLGTWIDSADSEPWKILQDRDTVGLYGVEMSVQAAADADVVKMRGELTESYGQSLTGTDYFWDGGRYDLQQEALRNGLVSAFANNFATELSYPQLLQNAQQAKKDPGEQYAVMVSFSRPGSTGEVYRLQSWNEAAIQSLCADLLAGK